jgi:hypothetical protein
MTIELNCPSSQTRIRVPESAAGKKARCPKCQAICEIPPASDPLSSLPPLNSPRPSTSVDSPTKSEPPSNPFSDSGSTVGSGAPGPLNPYASPAHVGLSNQNQFTRDEVRAKLLGPAIGIAVGALFCLAYASLATLRVFLMPPRIPPELGEAGYYLVALGTIAAMSLPSLCMFAGSFALFTGTRPGLAWVGVIAAVLPCNPCCFINIGFGIWGIVVLSDPRVTQAMQ